MIKNILDIYNKNGQIVIDDWMNCEELIQKCCTAMGTKFTNDINLFKGMDDDELKIGDNLYFYNFRGYGLQIGGFKGKGDCSSNYNNLFKKCDGTVTRDEYFEIYKLTALSLVDGLKISESFKDSDFIYFSKQDIELLSKLADKAIDRYRVAEDSTCLDNLTRREVANISKDKVSLFTNKLDTFRNDNSDRYLSIAEDDDSISAKDGSKFIFKVDVKDDRIVFDSQVLKISFPLYFYKFDVFDLMKFIETAFIVACKAEAYKTDQYNTGRGKMSLF